MSRRKIHPPDEKKDERERVEFLAPKTVKDDFHAFKRKYSHPNLAEALKHLLKVAEKNPRLFSRECF